MEIVDSLPMNATGKVTKFVLRERALGKSLGSDTGAEKKGVPPRR